MTQSPRKRFFRGGAATSSGSGKFCIHLSGMTAIMASVILIAVIGWAFFMGFMVGSDRSLHSVGQMAGLVTERLSDTPETAKDISSEFSATDRASLLPEKQAISETIAREGQPENGQSTQAPAPKGQEGERQPPPQFNPFSRPQGKGMAAWGDNGTPQDQADVHSRAAPIARDIPQKKFDYVYQVAAFKDKTDADKVLARLEKRGMRSRLQKSGKVFLVMVSLRGTEQDAAGMRKVLAEMKLGKPLLSSKREIQRKSSADGEKSGKNNPKKR